MQRILIILLLIASTFLFGVNIDRVGEVNNIQIYSTDSNLIILRIDGLNTQLNTEEKDRLIELLDIQIELINAADPLDIAYKSKSGHLSIDRENKTTEIYLFFHKDEEMWVNMFINGSRLKLVEDEVSNFQQLLRQAETRSSDLSDQRQKLDEIARKAYN